MLDDVGGVLAHRGGDALLVTMNRSIGNRKHAQAVLRIPVVGVHDLLAQGVGHLHDLAVHANLRRKTHHLVGGALHERHAGSPVEGTLKLVNSGHALATALEGKLAHAGNVAFHLREVNAGLLGRDKQARLGWVPKHRITAALLLGGKQTSVRAQRAANEKQAKVIVV